MAVINKRYEFVLFFDVKDGNPNGDPDAGNLPRIDSETGMGLVTDVCLKRKVRNYVALTKNCKPPFDIFIKEKGILNETLLKAYADLEIDLNKPPVDESDGKKRDKPGKAQKGEVEKGRDKMCKDFFDVRTFGAVMSTGPNAGQVRGPVQMTFARSIDPVVTLEHSITRMAVATKEESDSQSGDNRTMGRKYTVPYGLYRAHGFVSAHLADQTGFSTDDLDLFWKALQEMFEHDRSAARGLMSMRRLIIFEHESPLGNKPAHELFNRLTVRRKTEGPAREFSDYEILLDDKPLTKAVYTVTVK